MAQQGTASSKQDLDIELDEDLPFQKRSWTAQRIGWGVIAFIVLLGLAGIFGSGPLSHGTAKTADGALKVDFERIARYSSPIPLRVDVAPRPGRERSLWISHEYVRELRIRHIDPTPERVEHHGDRLLYVFHADPSRTLRVSFETEFRDGGTADGHIGLPEGGDVRFRQLIFP
jgi:hypothetical protein